MTKKPVIITAAVALFGILCGIAAGGAFALFHDLPQIQALETYTPPMVTRIYSADNILLAELYKEKRRPVSLDDIPKPLTSALLATEDRHFYEHPGVDITGIARAVIKDISTGKFTQGASTITQQLAKTLFLTPEKTILRKIREAVLALQLERRYTKNEILAIYLNQVYFGSGAYGVESAADIFFNKSLSDLSLAECALIVGALKAPSRLSPLVNPKLSVRRRDIVLSRMKTTGVISEKQYETAGKEPLKLSGKPKNAVKAPWFVAYVKQQLEDMLGSALLYKGGLTVNTTLSWQLQAAGESAVEQGLLALENRMQEHQVPDPRPQAALVCVENNSGRIRAMIGGRDFEESRYNRCTAMRQPGSAFKPLVYALAVEKGFSQNRRILDAPLVFENANNGMDWEPGNYSGTFLGEITLRKALALSKNTTAIRLIDMLGPSSVSAFAGSLGIGSPLKPNLSLALGTAGVSLIDLTAAYTVFADKGERIDPYAISEVFDGSGRSLWRNKPRKHIVMSRQGAAIVCDMLSGVVKEGTARRAKTLPGEYAGKTGTTDDYRDALFVGFSPVVTVGVWVGQDRYETLGPGETGARAALPIWMNFMKKVPKGRSPKYFDMPEGAIKKFMNPDTGNFVPAETPGAVEALFRN